MKWITCLYMKACYWCNRGCLQCHECIKKVNKKTWKGVREKSNFESVLCIWWVGMDFVVHFKVGQLDCAKRYLSSSCSCSAEPLSSETLPHCALSLFLIYAPWITPLGSYGRSPADPADAASPFGNSSSFPVIDAYSASLAFGLQPCADLTTNIADLNMLLFVCLVGISFQNKLQCHVPATKWTLPTAWLIDLVLMGFGQ